MTAPHLHILGVDPGATTGWCRITVPRKTIYGDAPGEITEWETGEIKGDEPNQVRDLARLCRQIQSLDYKIGPAIVCEDFDVSKLVTTDAEVLYSPVRIAAMIRMCMALAAVPSYTPMFGDALLVMQSRGMAKSTATDERLRAWGLWTKGSDHERDATRHAITALRRAKQKPAFRAQMWRTP
jgi:hypothetical protein